MNRNICFLTCMVMVLLLGCSSHKYSIFQYDNGDDYFEEGLQRVVDREGKIGFADERGNVVIAPRFAFVFPFQNGVAKATFKGHLVNEGEHSRWISPDWFYVDHKGSIIPADSIMTVKGSVYYKPDGSPLVNTVIARKSDNYKFLSDQRGRFEIATRVADSLQFSYVGTVNRTVPVTRADSVIDVGLEAYVPGNDEYIFRIESRYPELETRLKTYVAEKDMRIGVALIVNGKDTISVNGNKEFPMMSVFKFPLAISVAKWVDANGMSLDDHISFAPELLVEDTYSPMLKKYGKELNRLSVRELLEWALIESDNNAADILLHIVGGPTHAASLLKDVAGELDIKIEVSEKDIHEDRSKSLLNTSTPLAMAELFDRFDGEMRNESASFMEIATMLERCLTGLDRLSSPFGSTNAVIGHKTGTGFDTADGGITAVNDCGYVHLPNGTRYSIAVFIADSPYGIEKTSKIIADISEVVFKNLNYK